MTMSGMQWLQDGSNRSSYPLSRPVTELRARYSAIVVGSGYGGAVAAAKLSRKVRDVCLLERGREALPGEYPTTECQALSEFQIDDGRHRIGSRQALFDVRLGKDIGVLIGCGLGGTSLINAAVCVTPDPRVFSEPAWPHELRAYGELQRYYQSVARGLNARPYPTTYPNPRKLSVLKESVGSLGIDVERAPLAISFIDGLNSAGVAQPACSRCGDCCSGCNSGAKNTTLMNYLPEARRHGTEIFTGARVTHVLKYGLLWRVYFESTDSNYDSSGLQFVSAPVVILAAGTLGSTEILLRSAKEGLQVSSHLGHHFSGNADVQAFSYNGANTVNGIGIGDAALENSELPGPCITGLARFQDENDFAMGHFVEEGVVPGPLRRTLSVFLPSMARLQSNGGSQMARDDVVDSITSDAMSRTLTLLAMGHDSGRGVLTLGERSRVHLEWQGAHDEPSIRRTHELLLKITQAARGSLVKSPHLIVPFMNHDFTGLITVHPLGGCVMGESAESAVVNHKGQVFSGLTDNSVHDGLYICDGSVLPTSIGANPLLTIGAIAERTVDLMLQERTWSESSVSDVESSHHHQQMRQAGLRFSEQMLGHYTPSLETGKAFSTGVRQQQGANEGAASECRLFMTLSTNNLEQLLAQAPHALLVEGMFEVDGHRASPFDIEYGTFRIFTQDSERPDIRKMEYELDLRGADGKQYFFYGEKLLKDNAIFAVWSETTRMQFALHEGPDCSGSLVGGGLLQISASDFVQQLRSLTVTNVSDAFKRTEWTAKFGKFFAANLFQIYGHVRAGPTPLDEAHRSRVRRQLRSPDPQIHELNASDGTLLRLTRYRGGAKGPVIAAPGFGVTADSFAADTQQVNLVEYLTEFGYDVWLFDYRASPALAGSMEFSIDDIAQYDWPAAVRYVTQHCSCKSVQVIAHCVGSMTLLMAIADGMTQVRSAICSQLALHAHNWWITQLGAGFDVPTLLRRAGIQSLDINHHTQLLDLVDGALSIVPTPPGEACASPVCRRIFALFGPSYKHDNLNHATHEAVAEMFGVTSVAAFEQLARIVRHGHVVDKTGLNRYLRVGRLQRLALPVLFLAGADNQLFPPRCSEKTVELLGAVNGSQLYERSVIPGYAHMDLFIGKEAHRDVFPLLTDYLARS